MSPSYRTAPGDAGGEPPPGRHFALVPAGGAGTRMGVHRPKQYLPLAGRMLIEHAVAAFQRARSIERIYVVVAAEDERASGVPLLQSAEVSVLPVGGASRRDTVLNGLQAIAHEVDPEDWVLVHDAARPGLTPTAIERLIAEVGNDPVGGLLALPVVDTIKRVREGLVLGTEPRDALWLAQTPQMFRHRALIEALRSHPDVTDESQAIERCGLAPRVVRGERRNLKVTLPEDLDTLQALWTLE
ncbi:MAG: 2-C-methyl-D-erythritol 4-phosphate cytidylyltransferase [Burkholderiales bacterium]|nr:MAG: 2-C-methyl-D-erythritol 4-phosphate cytidylyltransferase [Burkholderiales bacterium]